MELLEEAAESGAKKLMILGGGEPMISSATVPLMRRAKALGMTGMLTTNGTLMPTKVLETMVEIGWDEVHFSVDGGDAPTHDLLRGRPGAFRRTVSTACRLRRLRTGTTPRIALHTVVTRPNYRQLSQILRLASAVGAFRVDFDALVAYRPEQQALALTPAETAELPDLAAAALQEAQSLQIESTLSNFLKPLVRGQQLPASGTGAGIAGAPCLKAWHHLVIQADGRISPCCVLSGAGESLATGSLQNLWKNSEFLQGIRDSMRKKQPTGRCRECSENILAHERAIRGAL
jgi:radical SAM protein with 4Fe4S-binding SPASM domain